METKTFVTMNAVTY